MSAVRLALPFVAVLVLSACGTQRAGGSDDGLVDLLPSVQANTFGTDSVEFVLQVTNTTPESIPLEFTSGQSFDFVVARGGRGVWTWSAEQMFTQALRSESLRPGATETYRAVWRPDPDAAGEFTVVGVLTAQNQRVRQTTTFRLP